MVDADRMKCIEQKITDSFKRAVRYGQMLQAGDHESYSLKTKHGDIRLIDIVKTDKIHVKHCYAEPDTMVKAHTHYGRETYFILSGEHHIYCHKQRIILREGQTYYVDTGIPHASYFPVATELMIVFCPPEQDGRSV